MSLLGAAAQPVLPSVLLLGESSWVWFSAASRLSNRTCWGHHHPHLLQSLKHQPMWWGHLMKLGVRDWNLCVIIGWWGLHLCSCFLAEALMGGLEHWAWLIQQHRPYPRFLIQRDCSLCRELNLHFSSLPPSQATSFCLKRRLPCSLLTLHLQHPRLVEQSIQTPEEKAMMPQPTTRLLLRWAQAEQCKAGGTQLRPSPCGEAFCPDWFHYRSRGRFPFYHSPGRKNRCLWLCFEHRATTKATRRVKKAVKGTASICSSATSALQEWRIAWILQGCKHFPAGPASGESSWLFLSFKWFTADNPAKL